MDEIQAAVKTCFSKYADFEGRAARPEYWWFILFCIVLSMLTGIVFKDWINTLIALALVIPQLAAGSRRLHDIGKSGWFQLLWLIPLIGWAILIYWLAQPGTGANEYGESLTPAPANNLAPGQQ